MTIVLDTSALVALHVPGVARTVVHHALQGDETWCASALALSEAIALIDHLTNEEVLRNDLEDALRHTWDYVAVVPVDQRCLNDAALLTREQPLQISDAIHLAAARRLPKPIRFITFDAGQIPVALSLGFEVIST
ncbi:MAG: type II toxin-antitoxin system VapC family toxin [Ilumatobacteraceae bacterium]